MKNRDTRFFDFLNWIFKKSKNKPENYQPSIFLLNRWVSMAELHFAKIVNLTTNKWAKHFSEINYGDFYYTMFPKYGKNIKYIKKTKSEKSKDNEDYKNVANLLECSVREIEMYKNTLEELELKSN
jgi:hypothetical protein